MHALGNSQVTIWVSGTSWSSSKTYFPPPETTACDDSVARRLPRVDVLTRLAGHHGHQGVPVVGRRDGNGVDALVVEQPAKVLLGPGCLSGDRLDSLHRPGEVRVVDVAEGDDLS